MADHTDDNPAITAEETLEEVERRLTLARGSGDRAAEADILARKAYVHTARGEANLAIEAMQASRDITAALGDPAALMGADYGLGLLLERVPERRDDAINALKQAAEAASKLDDRVMFAKSTHRFISVYEAQGKLYEAIAHVGLLGGYMEHWQNWRAVADCHRHLAALYLLTGGPHEAMEQYDKAAEAAIKTDDRALLLQIRIERRAIHPGYSDRAPKDSWEDLAHDADLMGQGHLLGSARLQQAAELMRAGKAGEALTLAEEARSASLEANSPMSYLLACLLIAEARDALNDKPGVIAILLTCKASLEKQYGKAMGEPVVRILDSLPARWSKEKFQEVLAEYRRRAHEYAPGRN